MKGKGTDLLFLVFGIPLCAGIVLKILNDLIIHNRIVEIVWKTCFCFAGATIVLLVLSSVTVNFIDSRRPPPKPEEDDDQNPPRNDSQQ